MNWYNVFCRTCGAGCTCLTRRMGCTLVRMMDRDGRVFRVAIRGNCRDIDDVASRIEMGEQFKVKYIG